MGNLIENYILNINLYDYFSNIIGLKENPITHEHLEYFGYKFFTFKKLIVINIY